MDSDERLREALLELDVLRRREVARSRESAAILSALEAMATTPDAAVGIAALLESIKGALGCDLVALFASEEAGLRLRYPDDEKLGHILWDAPGLVSKRRRIVDLQDVVGLWDAPPPELSGLRSLLSVPIEEDARKMVMVAFAKERAAFSPRDADLMQRLATIASQAIIQRTLEEQSAFLSAVIDASPVSVAIADAGDDLNLVYVNDAFTDLTGYTPEEVIGQNCRFMSAEPAGSDIRRDIRETLAKREEGHFVLRNRRKSGEEFWNELRLFPITDDQGVAKQIVATQIDATTRVNAEIDRDNARRRFESALSATSEGFLVIGARGRVRFRNAVFQDLFGDELFETDQPLTVDGLSKLLGEPDLPAGTSVVGQLQEPINREIKARNGRQVLLRARPIEGGGAVVAATDVTQTKVNERVLRQRLAAIEMSQDGIAIGDPDGRVLHANPSLVALWDLSSEAYALGRRWINFYDDVMRQRFEAQRHSFDQTGVWRDEIKFYTLDGRQRVHDVSLSRLAEVGTVLIVRDITERQSEEEERQRLRQQLDKASMQDHLHQVSAGLAHDFNNLLSAILGSASLIERLDDAPAEAEEAAKRIELAARKAVGLVDGFLDLGQRERETEKLDLVDVVLMTVDLARAGAPEKAMLVSSAVEGPIWVTASQTDLLQVVMNLIVNGIDALDGKAGEVHVTVSDPGPLEASTRFEIGTLEPGQSYAAIHIQDTGKGIPEDVATQILEPYFTTKGNKGTGLGLAIVKSKLNANGGLMTLVSDETAGTTFTIYWPIHQEAETPPECATFLVRDRRGLPVLVIDDQPEVAEAIAATLLAEGYDVAETSDPQSALETVLESPDDWGAVITDYDMPGLSGGEVVAHLSHQAPELPVIVVSALAKRLDDPRIKLAKAVLSKPVNPDRLTEEVKAALCPAGLETEDAHPVG